MKSLFIPSGSKLLYIHEFNYKMKLLFICFLIIGLSHAETEYSTSEALASGSSSFEEHTYGKDGVILFYNDENLELLQKWFDAVESVPESSKINFWHLNCDITNFCFKRPEIKDITRPAIMYSFRNLPWKGKSVASYTQHAFEVFFNTKMHESCLNKPSLCNKEMKEALEIYRDKPHKELKEAYEEAEEEIKRIESKWEEISNEIQKNWGLKKAAHQSFIEDQESKQRVLKLLMEQVHIEAYDKVQEDAEALTIDKETWDEVKNNDL